MRFHHRIARTDSGTTTANSVTRAGEGRYDTSRSEIDGGELGALAKSFGAMLKWIGERDRKIKLVNEELAHCEAYANLIIDTVPEVIPVVDTNGCIALANDRVENVFGYRKDELLGQLIELLIHDHFRAQHQQLRRGYAIEPTRQLMGQGRERFGRHKDGHEIPVEIGLAPMK